MTRLFVARARVFLGVAVLVFFFVCINACPSVRACILVCLYCLRMYGKRCQCC